MRLVRRPPGSVAVVICPPALYEFWNRRSDSGSVGELVADGSRVVVGRFHSLKTVRVVLLLPSVNRVGFPLRS